MSGTILTALQAFTHNPHLTPCRRQWLSFLPIWWQRQQGHREGKYPVKATWHVSQQVGGSVTTCPSVTLHPWQYLILVGSSSLYDIVNLYKANWDSLLAPESCPKPASFACQASDYGQRKKPSCHPSVPDPRVGTTWHTLQEKSPRILGDKDAPPTPGSTSHFEDINLLLNSLQL